MEKREARDAESTLHKVQVVVAQALRAIQVIGGAGILHHKRILQYGQHA
jgi:hypothetical protein